MEGKFPTMPVIIGNTSEETMPWADTAGRVTDDATYAAAIDRVFGAPSRERILAQYPVKSYPTPRLAFMLCRAKPNTVRKMTSRPATQRPAANSAAQNR